LGTPVERARLGTPVERARLGTPVERARLGKYRRAGSTWDKTLAQVLSPLVLVQRQDHQRHVGDLGVRPAGGHGSVFPQHRNADGLDLGAVLDAALEYLGRRCAEQTLNFAHGASPVVWLPDTAQPPPFVTDVGDVEDIVGETAAGRLVLGQGGTVEWARHGTRGGDGLILSLSKESPDRETIKRRRRLARYSRSRFLCQFVQSTGFVSRTSNRWPSPRRSMKTARFEQS